MANPVLANQLAKIAEDYRQGEIPSPDAAHVLRWVSQFDEQLHDPILSEMVHVFGRSYLTKARVQSFLTDVATDEALTGGDPKSFWKSTMVLNVQRAGNSQTELLSLFDNILKEKVGVAIEDCPADSDVAVYIDDVVFSGGHVRNDLTPWIKEFAPKKGRLTVVVLAYHTGGRYYANQQLQKAASEAEKSIDIGWGYITGFEDRRSYINSSDVLRPTRLPEDPSVQGYAAYLRTQGFPPILRNPGQIGAAGLFSSEAGRDLIEQQFLIKGAHIREICPYLNEYQRPLGNSVLKTLGFGSLVVTFRNCANNCPLALWAGNPWIPLFPRKTN
jgi:hypothetical protein